jgi:diguanylate cyclase (GGDEF)-like protein
MQRGERPELLWGLGLNDDEIACIEAAVGPGFILRNFPEDQLPWRKEMEQQEKPSVVWTPWRVWRGMSEHRRETYRQWEGPQRILIQDENDETVELEEVLEQGFLTVIRKPLSRPKLQDAFFRAKEVAGLYEDIYRMTQEIFLERELLARKTDQLLFLNKMLTRATESLEAEEILAAAREDLSMVLPVRTIQAVFWSEAEEGAGVDAEVYLHSRMDGKTQDAWIEFLLESARGSAQVPIHEYRLSMIHPDEPVKGRDFMPVEGRVVSLPLNTGNGAFGVLCLLCGEDVRLAKDQVQTLRAAGGHLAMALKNALAFKQVKARASRDGLTRIYNRQSLDERLLEELSRGKRYGQSLSLLMLDLDHFKHVNDRYGHDAGDEVLRETAQVLQESLRSTDMAARYGGEEFVVVLPHTSEGQAWKLAERIRRRIGAKRYRFNGTPFNVTASIGVASLQAKALDRGDDLLKRADRALYQAKTDGRNMVVVSGLDRSQAQSVVYAE